MIWIHAWWIITFMQNKYMFGEFGNIVSQHVRHTMSVHLSSLTTLIFAGVIFSISFINFGACPFPAVFGVASDIMSMEFHTVWRVVSAPVIMAAQVIGNSIGSCGCR